MKEWIVGRNPVYEVLRAERRKVFRLWVAQKADKKRHLADAMNLSAKRGIPAEFVPREELDKLGENHQGVALEVGEYPYSSLFDILDRARQREEPPFILILDTVQDTHNLGALLRTAEAVGVHGVLLPLRRTATVTPAVVSTSSGASEHLLVAQTNLARVIEDLKKEGIWVYGLEGSAQAKSIPEVDLSGALALVVGNEAKGMRALVSQSCDVLLQLPMRGNVDSLNAAVAGSVALYFAWDARKFS
ncbi:MAG: 23S rRNA (guanosine(2251)-2'-O)-methyltransferase RlmB [Anaerolineales bacterium]|nr:23S rRNA (guanosine(2251)-2'-O)-methyltransferase RlmB [Anaerolineales bacterium]